MSEEKQEIAKKQLEYLEEIEKIDHLHRIHGSPSSDDVTQRITNELLHRAGAKPSSVLKKISEIALGETPTKTIKDGSGNVVQTIEDASVQLNALGKIMDLMGLKPVENNDNESNRQYEEVIKRVDYVEIVGIEEDEG